MTAWLRAFDAERLKLKNTLAFWVVLVCPLAVAVLQLLVYLHQAHHVPANLHRTPAEAWYGLGRSMFTMWCALMLPLFVTLQTALLAALEHGNHQWKHLQALPLPRSAHYLAKLAMAVVMVACAYAILLATVPLVGWILTYTSPSLGVAGPPQLGRLVVPVVASFATCLLILALQTWVALHWRSFTLAVSVGIVATVVGFIASQSRFGVYFPWTMPMEVFIGHGGHAISVCIGVVGAVLVAGLGLADFLHRESL